MKVRIARLGRRIDIGCCTLYWVLCLVLLLLALWDARTACVLFEYSRGSFRLESDSRVSTLGVKRDGLHVVVVDAVHQKGTYFSIMQGI